MNVGNFIKTTEYQELKQFILNSILSLKVDTSKDDKILAREVHANELAIAKITKVINDFEKLEVKEPALPKPYR